MNMVPMTPSNKMKELLCVLFGHSWDEYGRTSHSQNGRILEEYSKCSCCGLENHDRSGYIEQFKKDCIINPSRFADAMYEYYTSAAVINGGEK